MADRLEITLIRFCAQRDYLPYSARVEISVDSCETKGLLELFGYIKDKIPTFAFDKENPCCKINNRTIYKDVKIGEIIDFFGRSFTLTPLSQKFALDDLVIDSSHYKRALAKVEGVIKLSDDDRRFYDSLLPFAFASSRSLSDDDYLGEAFFLFIAEMIRRYPKESSALISLISDKKNGVMSAIELGERIFPTDLQFDSEIFELKRKILSGYPSYMREWVDFSDKVRAFLKDLK